MEHKPPSRAYKIGSWAVLLAAVVGLTAFQWQAGGWEAVALTWVPVLVFFGPIGLALRCGWSGRSGRRRAGG